MFQFVKRTLPAICDPDGPGFSPQRINETRFSLDNRFR